MSAVSLPPAGLGLGTTVTDFPFHCSTSVLPPLAVVYPPTATQLCALRHDTPTSSVSSDPFTAGVGTIVHAVPSQRSASVALEPRSDLASIPTATQLFALEHETVVRIASGAPLGAAAGTTDHLVPSKCSAAGFTFGLFDMTSDATLGSLNASGGNNVLTFANHLGATLQKSGVDRKFEVIADDSELTADGADVTRVVLRVADEFGNARPFANDPLLLKLEGPAELVGDNPFALFGGVGAVWIRAKEQPGTVKLTATHPRLGSQTVTLTLPAAPYETA